MSQPRLRRVFRAPFNLTPQEYLTRRRLELATISLAQSDRKISEIARTIGYEGTSTFTRHFRRVCGTSPQAYRSAKGK